MARQRNRRRVAVLGGNRIPFARVGRRLRRRLQPGHVHRRAGRAGRPVRPGRRDARRGDRRRGAQAQPRLQPDARVRAGQLAVVLHAGVRPAAGVRHRSAGRRSPPPTASPPAATTWPPPAGWTPPPIRRSGSATTCAASCWGCAGPSPTSTGSSWSASCPPRWASRSRSTANRAPGCRWASTPPITAKEMGIKRVDQDELAAASHRNMAAAYDRGFFDDLVTPVPRGVPGQQSAPRLVGARSWPSSSRCSG